ncbi:SRPBCC family protein [Actinocorallia sp. API 0066]|uniref:SRPBCC family protein n=1 Tax=Actinocorallia sp. API 0066 TaxID=2896846 RepID=UPI001E64993C|nr:SRPBCC family protein [Actinocorallia sp. API 0066]MCD0449303.1 SRPBCC family protein [Actinocorallia sp. API 0066]
MAGHAIRTLTFRVQAPREVVFDVVADRCGYARFSMLRSVTLLTEGADGGQSVGAVHGIDMVAGLGPRERVVELRRPELMVYEVIGGMPVTEHVGTVELTDNGDGTTTLAYTMRSSSRLPLPERLYGRILTFTIRTLAEPIAAEAARRAADGPHRPPSQEETQR